MLRIASLLLFLLACTGCASVSVTPAPSTNVGAERAAAAGDHLAAARAWAATANESRGATRDHAWLMAADQYVLADDPAAARQAFEQVNARRLTGSDSIRHAFLAATFLADDGGLATALSRLSAP